MRAHGVFVWIESGDNIGVRNVFTVHVSVMCNSSCQNTHCVGNLCLTRLTTVLLLQLLCVVACCSDVFLALNERSACSHIARVCVRGA